MDLLVHVIDPIDRDEVLPAARFRIVLAQYDAVGSLQVVDGTNVFAVQAHNFHVLLNVQTFEHVAPPLITNEKRFVGEGGSWNQFRVNHVILRLRQLLPRQPAHIAFPINYRQCSWRSF
jgi:hypothetical protein